MRRLLAAALLAAALAVAGCGGGSDEPKIVSKDLYIAEADQVCASLADSIRGAGAANPQTPKEITEAAGVLVDVYGELLKKLQDLKPPTTVADRRGAATYVAAIGRTNALVAQLQTSAKHFESAVNSKDKQQISTAGNTVQRGLADFRTAQAQANQKALAYGFNLCGNLS